MNKTAIRQRRLERFIAANRIVLAADADSLMEKAVGMSEEERIAFMKNFFSNHGIQETISNMKNLISAITSKEAKASKYDQNYIKQEEVRPSKLKNLLNKSGDWSALLTFFLLLVAASTSDYYSLVQKTPGFAAELRSFLIVSGGAFITWAFKYIASKIK